jgi:hypothetical protein
MNILKKDNGEFNIECNLEELMALCCALNNIRQPVLESEFSTLIGISEADTRKIMDIMLEVIRDPAE